jgi:hypothetical protein
MDDFNSETDSDYTSYWRDWVSLFRSSYSCTVRLGCGGKYDTPIYETVMGYMVSGLRRQEIQLFDPFCNTATVSSPSPARRDTTYEFFTTWSNR